MSAAEERGTGRAEEWVGPALAAVVERISVTEAEVGARFPLYAEPGTGRWTTTGRGSWTGGFWAGLLWLRARTTGGEAHRRAAAACTARLAPWVGADTATRGLIFWYGTALAGDDTAAAALRAGAARACLAARDPGLGLVPWGDALGGPRMLARVDGVPGMVPLLAGAGPGGAVAAAAHLHRHLDLCLEGGDPAGDPPRELPGGATGKPAARPLPPPVWRFDGESGWLPCEDPPAGWSRGRAWLLLAVADALLLPEVVRALPPTTAAAHGRTGPAGGAAPAGAPDPSGGPGGTERLRGLVERLLVDGELAGGPLVPAADVGRAAGPCDTSAAAITAVALLKLTRVLPGPRAAECSDRARAILRRLVDAHLSGPGRARPAGMLLDGCYDAGKGLAVRHELVWGDFFLALALAALAGAVDLTRV
ncbi:sugar ABC transporter permease [Streptomyces sp. CB00455]|uniref:sugar ABC transporter permease n=1 Tax=Streptomyces sp. CB00455 TaxID=1703927 RepID=UPI00093E0542|nr:sugar ABC transporter permease [Streptomyces sp. CB00455]OKK22976.1 sugar ABC transporter permease [Streptomyces sp. CB00455]